MHTSKKNISSSLFDIYKKIWKHIPRGRRIQLIGLMFLMVLTSAFEVLSLGSVIPFIGILISPDKLNSYDFLNNYLLMDWSAMDIASIQLYITIIFCLAVLIAGALRIFLLFCQIKLSHYLGIEFGVKVFSSILSQDYQKHTSSNSSEMIVAVSKAQELIPYLLQPSLVIISSSMMALSIFFTLLYVDHFVTLVTVVFFVLIYIFLIKIFRKRLIANSESSAKERVSSLKVISESLGGIRDIILDGSHNYFINIFRESTLKVQSANSNMQALSSAPRFILETFGMVIIAALAFVSVKSGSNMTDVIPIFGVLALGAQKLLPLLQQIYAAFASILGNKASISEVVQRLDSNPNDLIIKDNPCSINNVGISFLHDIELKDIRFRFSENSPWILNGFNLKIHKGTRIGIVGETGCGKSTALDVLMSLLSPQTGMLLVDEVIIDKGNYRAWQSIISHVPQSIFLSDASVKENIAFGVRLEDIDDERVIKCARAARISETIEHMEKGYSTKIGDRGVRLSGGQRQRIGIARALYKKSSVIILDEATSALDNETEKSVMNAIYSMDDSVTIVIVAHRLSTLNNCDIVYKVNQGTVEQIKTNSSRAFL